MKRDMDIVRSILLKLEIEEKLDTLGFQEEVLLHHLDLMFDAGLLEGKARRGNAGQLIGASIQKISWEGYDFLEVSRNDDLWAKGKKRALAAGAWTLDLLKLILVAEAKTKLGL
jgi:hypothetical protein